MGQVGFAVIAAAILVGGLGSPNRSAELGEPAGHDLGRRTDIPGAQWNDTSVKPSVEALNIALVAVDFPDQKFVITQPKGSDLFGNPQNDLPTRFGFTFFPHLGGRAVHTGSAAVGVAPPPPPWLTPALVTASVYARLTRGQMLDVLSQDYVRTARAKGLTERRVVYVHAFRSAMPSLVTQLGIDIGLLLGGLFVVLSNLIVDMFYALLDSRVRTRAS